MNLNEQTYRIKQMMGLNESKLESITQKMIDKWLENIRAESEDWGLGEMDELDEVDSIEKLVLNNLTMENPPVAYIDLYKNSQRHDFDNSLINLEYHLKEYIPGIKVIFNNIIDTRKFGPGIDW